MEPTRRSDRVDPQGDLAILERARTATTMEPILTFGPWWYAPAIAGCLAGVTATAYAGPARDSAIVSTIVYVAAVALVFHDVRRQRVKPRLSGRLLVANLIRFGFVLALLTGWMVVQSLLDVDGWTAWASLGVGWVIVTGVLLGIRSALVRRRSGLTVAR